jgi:hypothetical protein
MVTQRQKKKMGTEMEEMEMAMVTVMETGKVVHHQTVKNTVVKDGVNLIVKNVTVIVRNVKEEVALVEVENSVKQSLPSQKIVRTFVIKDGASLIVKEDVPEAVIPVLVFLAAVVQKK